MSPNRDVIPFGKKEEKQPQPSFTPAEIDAARPDDDDESRIDYRQSNQVPTVNMFANLWTDSALVMEVFRMEEEPEPAEMLREYQEIHEIKLTDKQLGNMLGWMQQLSRTALKQSIDVPQGVRPRPAPPKPENPGIVTHKSTRHQPRGETA